MGWEACAVPEIPKPSLSKYIYLKIFPGVGGLTNQKFEGKTKLTVVGSTYNLNTKSGDLSK